MGSLRSTSGVVVVFDFDKTIIDCDSDNWVVDSLGVTDEFETLLLTMPWNTAIDKMMCELHSRGKSISDIADCLRKVPLDLNVVAAIKAAFALGCDLRVVSDANLFFITTILEHHGLLSYFTEINTNPAHVEADGRLRIAPYHDFHRISHGCPLCPPNMCKGKIIERIQEEVGPEARFVYLGDGKGDFCPMLKLSARDFAMPRKEYPVWELIQTSGGGKDQELIVKAEVHEWSSWTEQFETLLVLVQKASSKRPEFSDRHTSGGLIPVDCNPYAVPAVNPLAASLSHEGLPKPLRVHQ